ncbi:MAG: oligosaccharide flippase family protein, partial [Geminicoccaceae bacterium]
STLLAGFQNIGVVDFRKTLNFRKDFVFMASEKLVAVVVSVGLALLFRNYWALVGGIVISKLWRVMVSYAMHPFRPRLSLAEWRSLFAFTKWLLLQNIFFFLRNRIDRIVIAKGLGAASLGLYTIAFDLANLVTSELMAPIRRALLPGFAKLAEEESKVKSMFLEVFGLTLWLGAPIAIGMGLLALPLVKVLLGESWLPAVPIIQMLAIAGFIALLSSCSHPIFLALNRPKLLAGLNGLQVALLIPGLLIGTVGHGLLGAALAVVFAQLITALADITIMLRLLKLRPSALGVVAWRSLAALAMMAVTVHALMRLWPGHETWSAEMGLLLGAVALGGVVYVGVSLLLWRLFAEGQGPERHLVRQIRQRIPGWSGNGFRKLGV